MGNTSTTNHVKIKSEIKKPDKDKIIMTKKGNQQNIFMVISRQILNETLAIEFPVVVDVLEASLIVFLDIRTEFIICI